MVERCKLPLVPVMVNVNVPVGVFLLVPTLTVEFAGDGGTVTDAGIILQLLLAGQPVTLRLTVPENPFKAVTVPV